MTESVFEEAERIVGGDRRTDYGSVRESFERIAKAWSAVLPSDVTAEQVALCMIGLKLVRESHAHKRDNIVDIAGYARCLEKLHIDPTAICGVAVADGFCPRNQGHRGKHGKVVKK